MLKGYIVRERLGTPVIAQSLEFHMVKFHKTVALKGKISPAIYQPNGKFSLQH